MPKQTLAVTLSQQIDEQRREVGMSKNFYGRLIREGRMQPGEGCKHLARKSAILETLEELLRNDSAIPRLMRLRTIEAEIPD